MTTIFYVIWLVVALILFFALFYCGGKVLLPQVESWEKAIICAILAVLWPPALVLIVIGLPFYPIYRIIEKRKEARKVAQKPVQDDDDDDEPQGFDYEEHEDWTDGNEEYEDD